LEETRELSLEALRDDGDDDDDDDDYMLVVAIKGIFNVYRVNGVTNISTWILIFLVDSRFPDFGVNTGAVTKFKASTPNEKRNQTFQYVSSCISDRQVSGMEIATSSEILYRFVLSKQESMHVADSICSLRVHQRATGQQISYIFPSFK
jgi:hypothetical protein